MKYLLCLLCCLGSFGIQAQQTISDANAQARNLRNFHAIEIGDGIDLYLTQGKEAVAVSASSREYRDRITTEVINGVLKIHLPHNGWNFSWQNRKLKAYVSVSQLDHISAGGGSDIYMNELFSTPKLSIHISGGSDLHGKIAAEDLSLNCSGGSDAYLSGTAAHFEITASGGSDLHGFDLITDYCKIETSGGSDIRITANKEIEANSSGGSDIYYKGNANSRSSRSGGGSIRKVS
ncbi:MAG TPA: head GIN domain-containing protein [Sediminibacterium sp.]|nr:head GIN domain-containing protein [Sediminibacterium sp.]